MAVKNTDYYMDLGGIDAKSARSRGDYLSFPFAFPRESNSWQARAYWIGFDQETARMTQEAISEASPTTPPTQPEKTRPDANPEVKMPDDGVIDLSSLPVGAREHCRRLLNEMNDPNLDPKRGARIAYAVNRITDRWMKKQ